MWPVNPFSALSATIRGPQGWISGTRSSSSAAKTTAIIESITSNLRLGHKTYHCVAFQSLYTMPLENSSSNDPRAAMRQSKFLQNHPCASRALNIASIMSPSPLSKSSFSDLYIRKRIGLIRSLTCPHALPEFHCNVSYVPHALHVSPAAHWCHLLMSSATSALVACLLMSSSSQYLVNLLMSAYWPLTWPSVDRWLWPIVNGQCPAKLMVNDQQADVSK